MRIEKLKPFQQVLSALLVLTVVCFAVADSAMAQQGTARGISRGAIAEVTCIAEVERLREQVEDLRDLRDEIFGCNNNNQVFNGSGCVALESLTNAWEPNESNPTRLEFSDGTEIIVTRGSAGANGVCPDGYEPE